MFFSMWFLYMEFIILSSIKHFRNKILLSNTESYFVSSLVQSSSISSKDSSSKGDQKLLNFLSEHTMRIDSWHISLELSNGLHNNRWANMDLHPRLLILSRITDFIFSSKLTLIKLLLTLNSFPNAHMNSLFRLE